MIGGVTNSSFIYNAEPKDPQIDLHLGIKMPAIANAGYEPAYEMTDGKSSSGNGSSVRSRGGFFLSTAMALVLVMLALVITVIVALIVFFATTSNQKIECALGTDPASAQPSSCLVNCIKEGFCDATTARSSGSSTTPTTTTTPSSQNNTKVRDVRLPLWLIPISYDVTLKADIYTLNNKTFKNTGNVTMVMRCDAVTKTITMHINKLNITKDSYTLKENDTSTAITITGYTLDPDRQFVNFSLSEALVVGKIYSLSLAYEGWLNNDLAGLYWSSYQEQNETRFIATTQFQPTDARKAFPCFDEPALKAKFKIHMLRKENMTALSNMPVEKSTPLGNGWYKDTFQETVTMSTYLLAFIVCDFAKITGTTRNGTTFNIWARKSAISQASYSLGIGISILEYFEKFFDETYPLPKQDMIAIPDFAAGAMENWGLITYRETALLYDDKVSAASNKQRVAVVVSHELAHQWFGNLVSPSWWDDLWLNEGFASYVEYIGVDFVHPDWKMLDQFVTTDVHSTMLADSLASSHPIYVPVQHPDEINEIFDSISYGKGASLIRMMRFFLGDSVFQKALSNYIDRKRFSDAFHDDLWQAMQDEANRQNIVLPNPVKDILDTWILQMGFPVVTVKLLSTRGGNTQYSLTQKHFLQDDTKEPDPKYPSPYQYKWDIPLSVATSLSPVFNVTQKDVKWFMHTEGNFPLDVSGSPDWIVVNPKQYGFYRVNYENTNWLKLIDTLKQNHEVIDELNRAQLIDDAFNLALAGELDISIALGLTTYLGNETSYFPWEATVAATRQMASALERKPAYGNFRKYMQGLVKGLYDRESKNFTVNGNANIIDQYKQSMAVSRACAYDVSDCRAKAKELFKDMMNKSVEANPIHPNLRSTVYCYGLQAGGVDEWNFVFDRFSKENVAVEQVKLLNALGCTNTVWLLQRLLDYSIDSSKIRSQDSYMAVGAVASNTIGQFLAWNWLRGNWDALSVKFGTGIMLLGRFVESTTANFYTEFDLEQIQAFVAQQGDLGAATRAFSQAEEKTQANIKYLQKNYASIERWLAENAK